MKEMGELLFPKQLGYAIKRGIEIAIHSARVYLSNLPHDHLILKLDFKNAFNTIRRDKMLLAVKDLAPSLLPFVHSCFGEQKLFSRQKGCSRVTLSDLCFFVSQSTTCALN